MSKDASRAVVSFRGTGPLLHTGVFPGPKRYVAQGPRARVSPFGHLRAYGAPYSGSPARGETPLEGWPSKREKVPTAAGALRQPGGRLSLDSTLWSCESPG